MNRGDRMQTILELLLIFTCFLSVIPVINMFRNRTDNKYTCLKFLIYSTFFWTLLIVLERLSTNTILIYYSGMLGYPLRLLFASLMLCTVYQYVEKKLPKSFQIILSLLVLVDLTIALTNSQTLLFLKLSHSQLSTFNDLYISNFGPLFVYHLIVSYAVALIAIALLFIFLAKQKGNRQYKEVTRMMAISVLVVLVFNSLQLFFVTININLTYISLVFVAFILYDVIYRKDMVFNIRASGRSEILANMREMYVLTDSNRRIIEVSSLLLNKYNLKADEVMGKAFDIIAANISNRVTLYSEYNMDGESNVEKDHYHLREKEFKLKGMNESGYMILLYDETQVFNLLRELNRLSNYDTMTGLNNRNYIEHKLYDIKDTKNIGVFSLDLNGLKINYDYLGHERGVYLLKTLSAKMKKVFLDIPRKEIARVGGDEFLVITYGENLETLNQKKSELLLECDHLEIEKMISVSIGLAYDSLGDSNIFSLIQSADAQMYEMKSNVSKIYQKNMIEFIKLQDKFIR
ncbi:MAG: diguanylate cyclase [Acholeplasmataceae bacterium]|nr:diguanylate cyclase [Acholeplasmataceae bacterium]